MTNRIKVPFDDVKSMLEQLKYTNIKAVQSGIYTALNPYKEPREFIQIPDEVHKNDVMIISKRNLLNAMDSCKDFQTFECEFIADDESFKIYVRDYLISKSIEGFVPSTAQKEITDVSYK